ncbi:DUF4299 family protein [Campylobacter sp.]|uniref:DUF4299 family protein n=1 Tax=Campylobacter sp. TaxID=205 RepID=UPI0027076587|nr:DUF4299 family protein [Campylobacter sp.]
MSITFRVKNKKKFLSYADVLSVEEAFNISPNITQFSFDESAKDFDVEDFYSSKLSEYTCLLFGVEGLSGRGFELSYDNETKNYEIRILTPSTKSDWQIALEYMKNLSLRMGSEIISEEDEKFSADEIENFDYERDVTGGLKAIKNRGVMYMQGVYRPIAVSEKIVDEILSSSDAMEEFDELVKLTQYVDAYSANQKFYKNKDGSVIGSYALTQDVDTILPYEPMVEDINLEIKNQDVQSWMISFVAIEGDEDDFDAYKVIGNIDYADFIANLPKDKFEFLDANYILVKGLSRGELDELIAKCES